MLRFKFLICIPLLALVLLAGCLNRNVRRSGGSEDYGGSSPLSPSYGRGGGSFEFDDVPLSAAPVDVVTTSTLSSSSFTGKLGATVGGAKDIGFARRTIGEGKIPGAIDFSPEGLYSEHDIPTPSGECDSRLCLSLGYGFAPAADDRSNDVFVHLGMSSNLKAGEFRRTPLQLAVVVDRSGSMEGENIASVKKALTSLLGKLNDEDEIILITFSDAPRIVLPATRPASSVALLSDVELPMRRGGPYEGRITEIRDGRAAIQRAIDSIEVDGGTDIESALALGYRELAALPSRPGVAKRLMLFTDALPNSGRVDTASFTSLAERYARERIGLTAFGVGLDFGHDLIYRISKLRGGNYFYLETPEKIAKVFDGEFDYLVTPLVYDLKVKIATPPGLRLKAVYGLPTWTPGSRDAELAVPTVFVSSNRGAIVLRYERESGDASSIGDGELLATGELSYEDTDGHIYRDLRELRHTSAAGSRPGTQFYTHDGLRMAVALTNVYFGLRDGCRLYSQGKGEEALEAIGRARGLASLENLGLGDGGLADEIKLLDRLAENLTENIEK